MRVFVSSSFQDLQDYRLAAIRVLRQLGHEVVAMEDFVAGSEVPLKQMLDKVERCELYVGLFAWRYGFVPKTTVKTGDDSEDPKVPGAIYGFTSITHYEYLHAKAKGIDRLAFLLDERVPWPPHLVDGFSTLDQAAPKDSSAIRALRGELQLTAVVSYFSNPNDLEARVSAAVTVAGMSRQVRLNLASVGKAVDTVNDSAPEQGIRQTILSAGQQRALRIDLNTTWWSTRLYLTSALAERLTDVRRIVVTQGDEFVGLLSTQWIMSTLAAKHPTLVAVGKKLLQRHIVLHDAEAEMTAIFSLWKIAFGGSEAKQQEEAAKVILTADLLRRWFGDAMLQQPVRVLDLSRATVVELLRILDYPSEYVPVVSRLQAQPVSCSAWNMPSPEPIQVVDKSALNSKLAQSYVSELMDRARIG
ncbi:MAG: DUF4062 domain-containing protein [Nitrospira sp.]|nr:DUF4062 domain-containing protein [Nitrospira sp.]MDH4305527.1 DUF4062 domain-containing protein [Nitrospira sp.]MDH5195090.1 DUF4062 domain-containing protein [Nitrospira sp.]